MKRLSFLLAFLSLNASAVQTKCSVRCEIEYSPLIYSGVVIGPRPSTHVDLTITAANKKTVQKLAPSACAEIPLPENASRIFVNREDSFMWCSQVNIKTDAPATIVPKEKIHYELLDEKIYPTRVPLVPLSVAIPKIQKHPLIVVHASQVFDANLQAKAGIDPLIAEFKKKQLPVIYLDSDLSKEGMNQWYTDDRSPDYLAYSEGGENNLPITSSEVTLIGGFFGSFNMYRGCHTLALRDLITNYFHFQKLKAPLTVHLPISAIYFFDLGYDQKVRNEILKDEKISDHLKDLRNLLFEHEGERKIMGKTYLSSDGVMSDFDLERLKDRLMPYIQGPDVTTNEYRFEFYWKSKLEFTHGSGSKLVRLMFEK